MNQSASSQRKLLSIICPVFNEEECIPIFYERLQKVMNSLSDRFKWELLFVNNRSTDKTLDIILSLQKQDHSIQIYTMSRNFGYQASVQAGMTFASGEAVIVLDADCEDPPEMIPQFIEKWEEGYDIVYGMRSDRSGFWLAKKCRNWFYHLLRTSADMDIVLYMAEFALISNSICKIIINNSNTFPFLRAEIGYAGFSKYGISYKREPRVKGESHYNFLGMVYFGMAGLLTSSTFLMRLGAYVFPFVVLLNLIFIGLDINQVTPLFKVTVVLDLLYLIFLLTVFGVYQARIYKNGMGRPIFIIDPKLTHTHKDIHQPH